MPKTEGPDFEFTQILKPLEPFKEYLTVVSMMDRHQADAFTPEEVGADHYRSSAVIFTGCHPKQTMGSDIYCGPSIDQIYAHKFVRTRRCRRYQLATENQDLPEGPVSL